MGHLRKNLPETRKKLYFWLLYSRSQIITKKAKYVTSYNSKGSKSIPLEQGLRLLSQFRERTHSPGSICIPLKQGLRRFCHNFQPAAISRSICIPLKQGLRQTSSGIEAEVMTVPFVFH